MAARRLDSRSFAINLGLGRALLSAGRLADALTQMESCQKLAQDEQQRAAVYYWHAAVNLARGQPRLAADDWQALLDLPQEQVPPAWRQAAQAGLLALTPTPAGTPTSTPAPASASMPAPTLAFALTLTPVP